MTVELINTGTELMLGRVLNTHQQWLCRELSDRGYLVDRQVAVPDTGPAIREAVREGLGRADLIITTGGLGPTSDDLTRDLIAELVGRPLREDLEILRHIQSFFDARGRRMPQSTRVQARVPEGALVLANELGTAPGLAMQIQPNPFRESSAASWLIMLPGPPRELRPMFLNRVAPLLAKHLPPPMSFLCRTIRTTGLGESVVEERVAGPLAELVQAGLEVGYCARPGQVDVRLVARGHDCETRVATAEAIVRAQLRGCVYGLENDDIESVIIRELSGRGLKLAVAESCTGGCISHRLTNVPGASAVLVAGVVTYSNESKQSFLGVRQETLAEHGAVSEPVAREMAEGAVRTSGADYAISVTGIAGPAGGTETKPVGTVFIGLTGPGGTKVEKHLNPFDRETFKQVTAQQAMELLRREVLGRGEHSGASENRAE